MQEGLPLRYPGGPAAGRRGPTPARAAADRLARVRPLFPDRQLHRPVCAVKGILCQGRGSAANSAVCYVLGITAIDPVRSGLLFERFISAERREPPDIDVDFESERREEVIQWIYARYGRDRAALCATVMSFRARGAIRDVGKVMGLTEGRHRAAGIPRSGAGWTTACLPNTRPELNLNLNDRRLRLAITLARELIGFPRQLGTHPGGFVLTRDRLDELVPVEPAAMNERQVIEWDKDDIDALKFMKVDVLGLGMLGCMRRAYRHAAGTPRRVARHRHHPSRGPQDLRHDPQGGQRSAPSRSSAGAQMAMLPRLKPTTFYDLVVQVAIVRPGPIQGDMVHPYLRRREGLSSHRIQSRS